MDSTAPVRAAACGARLRDPGSSVRLPGAGVALDSSRSAERRERAAITLLVLALYVVGYFAVGWATDPAAARSLTTPLDVRVPFVPATIFLYAWVYTGVAFPLFSVRSHALFRRVGAAYAVVIAVSLAAFRVYPVGASGLRPEAATLDTSHFTEWGVRLLYWLDPPVNLFPSIHIGLATLAALSAWKARPVYGAFAFPWLIAVVVSISTVKQHFAIDGVAGFALAVTVYALIVRPQPSDPAEASAYGWGGPLLYLVFHCSLYAAAYVAYRAGFQPG